jgi:hypothetical protein
MAFISKYAKSLTGEGGVMMVEVGSGEGRGGGEKISEAV